MSRNRSILVIDDEESICAAFRTFFERRGWSVRVAGSAGEGLSAYREDRPGVVFLDVRLPDRDGLTVLEELLAEDRDARVIVITAYGGLDTVMRSLEGRAFDYLAKPIDLDRAEDLARRAIRSAAPPRGASADPAVPGGEVVGASPAMQEVFKRIGRLARRDATVLILGQTGTGKEVIARAIHEHSPRSGGPFVAVNCGALPENLVESELFGHVRGAFTGATEDRTGRFEAAGGGTLFLDEVGELPAAAQVKLLRVLDSGTLERVGSAAPVRVDVRIVAATNRDLAAEVAAGRFRADLYYRLAVVQVSLPPLAERREDILPLARQFLGQLAPGRVPPAIGDDAAELLRRYPWPGNVRELRNAVEHALAVCPADVIGPEDLPEPVRCGTPPAEGEAEPADAAGDYLARLPVEPGRWHEAALAPVERAVIAEALAHTNGNQSEAAALLGLHRNTLRRKIRELGLGRGAAP